MKPMHFAMALLSAVMFFILAGVFMGVQLELDGTKLVVDTAADIRWQSNAATGCAFSEPLHIAVFEHLVRKANPSW